jgi:subtilisin family serine protease
MTRALATPWAPHDTVTSTPGRVVLQLQLGEAPERIPSRGRSRREPDGFAESFGIGPIDRLLCHYSDRIAVTRVHRPARPGPFDDVEQLTGVARTFEVRLDDGCPVAELIDGLRCVSHVQAASPRYLTSVPLAVPATGELAEAAGWEDRDAVAAPQALAYEPGDDAVVIAVVDTGIASQHEAFAGAVRAGLDTVRLASQDLAAGIELAGDSADIDDDPSDEVGHGTETAAIIGARSGILPPGLGSGCGLMPMRALGAARMGNRSRLVGIGALVDIDVAIKYAVDLGARVINLSLGTPVRDLGTTGNLPHSEAIRYALARNCIVVAAAGNSGQAEDYVPACLDGVIAVGAADRSGRPAGFSSRSERVALSAPGERVLTAAMDGGYVRVTGTSFAAPFVSGAAAILVSRANRRAAPIDAVTVRRLLVETATPWPAGPAPGSGSGTLDAFAALTALDAEIDARWQINPRQVAYQPAHPQARSSP